jgi:hypothetical protein
MRQASTAWVGGGSRRPMPELMSADMKCGQSSTVAVPVDSLGLLRL